MIKGNRDQGRIAKWVNDFLLGFVSASDPDLARVAGLIGISPE